MGLCCTTFCCPLACCAASSTGCCFFGCRAHHSASNPNSNNPNNPPLSFFQTKPCLLANVVILFGGLVLYLALTVDCLAMQNENPPCMDWSRDFECVSENGTRTPYVEPKTNPDQRIGGCCKFRVPERKNCTARERQEVEACADYCLTMSSSVCNKKGGPFSWSPFPFSPAYQYGPCWSANGYQGASAENGNGSRYDVHIFMGFSSAWCMGVTTSLLLTAAIMFKFPPHPVVPTGGVQMQMQMMQQQQQQPVMGTVIGMEQAPQQQQQAPLAQLAPSSILQQHVQTTTTKG